jgi:thioredoxin-like negative regulator of GroEL
VTKHTILGLFLVSMLLVMASLILIPRNNEVALMQLEDGHYSNALDNYLKLIKKGDTSINAVMPLSQLYLQYGDIDKGIKLLEDFVAQHPTSADARKRLGMFYDYAQMPYAYMDNLEKLTALTPTQELLRELADSYEFHDLYDKQAQILAQLINAKDYVFKEEDYNKLAHLYASRQQVGEALSIMQSLRTLRGNQISRKSINLTISLLLDMEKYQEAKQIAGAYITESKDIETIISLANLFRERNKADVAFAFLRPFLEQDNMNPELLAEFIGAALDRGRDDEIVAHLMKQKMVEPVPEIIPETLVKYGLRKRDVNLLFALPSRMPLKSLSDILLLRYAEFAFSNDNPQMARNLRDNLGPKFLYNTPFLSALLAFAEDRSPAALEKLNTVRQGITLTTPEKLAAISLYNKLEQKPLAFTLLRTIPAAEMMEYFDVITIAETYLSLGGAEEGVKLFEEAQRKSPANANILHTLLLLTAGTGKEALFNRLVAMANRVTPVMLDDSLYMATKYKHNGLALNVASLLYTKNPTTEYRLQLAEAYITNKQFVEALEYLKTMVGTEKKAGALYLSAMSSLIIKEGMARAAPYQAEMEHLIKGMLRRPGMSLDEKRYCAFLLIKMNQKEQAEAILLALAKDAPLESQDTQDLLALWGENPGAEAIAWMKARAGAAQGKEQEQWLNYLYDKLEPAEIIAFIEGNGVARTPELTDIYINALVESKNKEKLAKVITAEFAKNGDIKQQKALALVAAQENMFQIAETGLRQLRERIPEDREVSKQLGLLLFAKGNYKEAETLLAGYLEKEEGDYQVNYSYGELSWRRKNYSIAKPYYAKSLEQIAMLTEKGREVQIMEAHLLYRLGKNEQAVELFQKLLAQYPRNKVIRTELGNIMIEMKRYKEATHILGDTTHE